MSRGGSRWTPEQIERGAAAMQDAYLATIDRFDAMNEFRVSVVAALDAVFPVGEPDVVEALKELFRRHGVSVHAGYEALAHGAVAAVRAASQENPE